MHIETAGAAALFAGLVALAIETTSIYTQIGIVCWLSAQAGWLCWWLLNWRSSHAVILMGGMNVAGSASFLAGCILTSNVLGCFISSAYLISSSQQILSGIIRLPHFHQHRLLARSQAMGVLICASFFQMLGAMGFIILTAIPGLCFSLAAICSFLGYMLKYHQTLLQREQEKQRSPFLTYMHTQLSGHHSAHNDDENLDNVKWARLSAETYPHAARLPEGPGDIAAI